MPKVEIWQVSRYPIAYQMGDKENLIPFCNVLFCRHHKLHNWKSSQAKALTKIMSSLSPSPSRPLSLSLFPSPPTSLSLSLSPSPLNTENVMRKYCQVPHVTPMIDFVFPPARIRRNEIPKIVKKTKKYRSSGKSFDSLFWISKILICLSSSWGKKLKKIEFDVPVKKKGETWKFEKVESLKKLRIWKSWKFEFLNFWFVFLLLVFLLFVPKKKIKKKRI